MVRHALVVDSEPLVRGLLEGLLRTEGWQPRSVESLAAARVCLRDDPPALLFTDLALTDGSGLDLLAAAREVAPAPLAVVLTARGSFDSAVAALRARAYDFLTKPILTDELRALLARAAAELDRGESPDASPVAAAGAPRAREVRRLIGRSPRMLALHELVRTVAESGSTVLIRGESGTGKELVARALHDLSARASGPLVPVNCGAIPEDLLESELFGHVRGAFTGAVGDRPGRFVLADGGTIFLDEVGDMSPKLQVKVLRVLQEQELEPVGGTQTVRVGVRVVAATNIDLETAIEMRRFREDLYYRLNVIPIEVPPLRERLEDLPLLTRHFLKIFNKRQARQTEGFSPEAMELLAHHHWPGNVRELENLVERMTILARGSIVTPDDLPARIRYPGAAPASTRVAFPAPGAHPLPPTTGGYPAPPPVPHRFTPAPPTESTATVSNARPAAAADDEGVSVEERVTLGLVPARTEPREPAPEPPALAHEPSEEKADAPTLTGLLEDYERAIITEAIRQSGGVKSRAAKALSIKRTTLVERMKKLGL